MARITVEDCLRRVESRFALVILAAKRAKMLIKGARPLVESDNKPIVVALREIASGKVTPLMGPEAPQVKMLEEEETGERGVLEPPAEESP